MDDPSETVTNGEGPIINETYLELQPGAHARYERAGTYEIPAPVYTRPESLPGDRLLFAQRPGPPPVPAPRDALAFRSQTHSRRQFLVCTLLLLCCLLLAAAGVALAVVLSSSNEDTLKELQTRVEALETGDGAIFWVHTNPQDCAEFTPSSFPVSVQVAAGGGGDGGGAGANADASPGQPTTVIRLINGVEAGVLMTAAGGLAGRRGGPNSRGQLHSNGSTSVDGAVVLAGGGGAGGDAGQYYCGHSDHCMTTGTAGGGGGLITGRVTLTEGQQLRACIGQGGAGGGSTDAGYGGAAGANGFVIISK